MKHFTILILTLLPCAVILLSCSPKVFPVQSCVVVSERSSELTVRTSGYGKKKITALDAAEKNAIETLLFRGIPGTQNGSPLVGIDETAAKTEYAGYFDSLLKNGRHKSFIISSVPVTDYSWTKYRAWCVTADVVINVPALRKDLETQGIIRRFGF